jgi:hypothetical protein
MFSRRLRNAYKSNVKSFNLVRNDCLLVPSVSGRRDLPAPGWQNAHVVGCFFLGSQGFTGQRFTFRVDGIKSGLQLDLTAEEAMEAAREAAVLAGLELVPAGNDTGFSCVYRKGSKYQAFIAKEASTEVLGIKVHLGCFATPQEAALHVARHKDEKRRS